MRSFLLQFTLFSVIALSVMLGVFMLADGSSDDYYLRFTSPPQNSLIMGTSRAAQALQPQILDREFKNEHPEVKFFNYSFTKSGSPYGPAYFESIQKKVDPKVKDGYFIVTVDPWSISALPEELDRFRESDLFLGQTEMVNLKPNLFYLIRSYQDWYVNIITNRLYKKPSLHQDGWLEINVNMDPTLVRKRITKKVEYYAPGVDQFLYSEKRMQYLEKTIEFLKMHGKVYMVRLPVHKEILDLEAEFMPNFDLMMDSLSNKFKVPYKNYTISGKEYIYTDGNHLHKSSGAEISKEIADWMIKNP